MSIGGVDLITALLFRRNIRDVRARGGITYRAPGLMHVEPPPPIPRGQWFYKAKVSRPVSLQGGAAGVCDWYGNIYVTRTQSLTEQQITLYHEWVHSVMSPRFKIFLHFRARLKATGYNTSSLLKYVEEALAEGYAQLPRGIRDAFRAFTFPVGPPPYGYVTVGQLASESAAIGSIIAGGQVLRVALSERPPAGLPAAQEQ